MKTILQQIRNPISPLSSRRVFVLITVVGLTLSPMTQGVTPAPDGGFPNHNTAEGEFALQNLTTGGDNTAIGSGALFTNTTGSGNTAIGRLALLQNSAGFQNTAVGFNALFHNTTGFHNTAIGIDALFHTTSGNHNTADGDFALVSNTTGNFNTVEGAHALITNTTGSFNIALGLAAGENLTGSNNIDISNGGVAAEANTIRIGNEVPFTDREGVMHSAHSKTFIAGISGATVSGSAVVVNNQGQLGVLPSSARFKDKIKAMDKASEAILALKPVTFQYSKEIDAEDTPQFGLVAEEVAKVNPDLVIAGRDGKPFSVRYDAVNAMLLNEFLKEHRKVEEQGTIIAKQQKQIEALTAGLQKVSAQLEANKPTPRVVANDQ
ncbi:MAG TPA: tail fiber domain-containing protein [Candidatus Udaeobacter sp.]|nr:tail fiber domain-containing protein [Candidatus Udaeobacter sp.]